MTDTAHQAKPPARKSRVPDRFTILFLIGADAYAVVPLPAAAAVARRAYRLVKKTAGGAVYDVRQAPEGYVECSCPGHTYRGKCRHVRALAAAGMIDRPARA